MRSKLGDKIRIQHILEAIIEIEGYIEGLEFDFFMDASVVRFASIKQLEIIGEACNHLSQELKQTYTSIEWTHIIGMRNVFVHEYFGVDLHLLWEIIKNDIPELKSKIIEINNSFID